MPRRCLLKRFQIQIDHVVLEESCKPGQRLNLCYRLTFLCKIGNPQRSFFLCLAKNALHYPLDDISLLEQRLFILVLCFQRKISLQCNYFIDLSIYKNCCIIHIYLQLHHGSIPIFIYT